MIKQISLPCGISKCGELVYIDDAKNGLDCECICPACKQPLVAKNNGKKREHHFAHLTVVECEHGYQSALHYMAKDLFIKNEYLTFIKNNKPVLYKIDSVELEKKFDEIVPDIIVTCDGKQFIIEIFVTHAVDDVKKEKIKSLRTSAVEIDLSRFHKEMIDKESLRQELCKPENFSWVYDSDVDLIADKKDIIQKFGLKIPLQIGYSVGCPILVKQKNKFARFVTLDFCVHCPNCVYIRNSPVVHCGRAVHLLLSNDALKKLQPMVFVNEGKVMLASEFRKYNSEFFKNLQGAVQSQYRIFLNISRRLYFY